MNGTFPDRGAPARRDSHTSPGWHATTVLGIQRDNAVAVAGDGQVTFGDIVIKHGARKIRSLYDGKVVAGFAGAVADALTLFEKFESHLRNAEGDLRRAAIDLAREWRTDRYLRRLEAQLIVANKDELLVVSGDGDVIAPDDGIVAIGTGGAYATAAARALLKHTQMDATEIADAAMRVTAELCIYTNDRIIIETTRQQNGTDEDE